MKNLLIISLLVIGVLESAEYDKHFRIDNSFLKILKLNESELILYGDKGGVIRSYDSGETWKQDFSGTHSNILKMLFHDDKVIGLNDNNQIMISEDKGELWKIYPVELEEDTELNDLTIIDDLFVLSTKSNAIFISNDATDNWSKIEMDVADSIVSITEYQNNLIIQNKDNSFFYSEVPFDNWKEININQNLKMIKKNNIVYFYNNNSITELLPDFTLKKYFINTNISGFYPNDNYIFIVNENIPQLRIETYNYEKLTNELEPISQDTIKGLDREYYQFYDIDKFDDAYIVTNIGKTYLKFENSKWKLLSYWNTLNNPVTNVFDRNHFFSRTLKGNVRFSTDGGASFRQGEFISDTTVSPVLDSYGNPTGDSTKIPQRSIINSIHFLGGGELFIAFDNTVNSKGHGAYSKDYGKSLEFIDNSRLINASFINYSTPFAYFYQERAYPGKPRRDINFYRLNINNFEIDSINSIDSVDFIRPMISSGRNNLYSVTKISDYESSSRSIEFYNFSEDFSEFEIVNTINKGRINRFGRFLKYENKLFYKYSYVEINSDDSFTKSEIMNLETYEVSDYSGIFFDSAYAAASTTLKEQDTVTKFDIILDTTIVNGIPIVGQPTVVSSVLARASFNEEINEFEFKFLDTLENPGAKLAESIQGDFKFFVGSGYWMPIEKNQNATSVKIENGGPPSIWTLNAYPNPVTDRVKIAFYSAKMSIINNLKIEVINISTGVSNYISEFEINILDGYNGLAEFDLSAYPSGAYLINLTLDGKSMSESIIKN